MPEVRRVELGLVEAARHEPRSRASGPRSLRDRPNEVPNRQPARGGGDEQNRGEAGDQNRSDKGTEAGTLQAALILPGMPGTPGTPGTPGSRNVLSLTHIV
jgi:hypothetical protein